MNDLNNQNPNWEPLQKGVIYVANEARFSAANFSEPLTAFSIGWKDPENIEDLLDFVAPAVPVGKRFEFKKGSEKEAFFTEEDDVRAIGASFKRVEFSGSSVMGKTLNKGLTIRLDHDDIVGDDWRERYLRLLLKRIYRNELRRAIQALDSAAKTDSSIWSLEANGQKNPDADLREKLATAADEAGIRPNRILFGEGAWDLRSDVYDCQNTAAAQRAATSSLEDLAHRLFVDEIRILTGRFQTGSGTGKMLGADIYMFNSRNDLVKDEPANIKRFITPIDGAKFRVYEETHSKYTDLTVEHYSNVMVTSSAGIVKLSVGNQ